MGDCAHSERNCRWEAISFPVRRIVFASELTRRQHELRTCQLAHLNHSSITNLSRALGGFKLQAASEVKCHWFAQSSQQMRFMPQISQWKSKTCEKVQFICGHHAAVHQKTKSRCSVLEPKSAIWWWLITLQEIACASRWLERQNGSHESRPKADEDITLLPLLPPLPISCSRAVFAHKCVKACWAH